MQGNSTHFSFKSERGARTLAKKRAARMVREHRKELAQRRIPFSGVMQVDACGWPKVTPLERYFVSRPLLVLPIWVQFWLWNPDLCLQINPAAFPPQPTGKRHTGQVREVLENAIKGVLYA